MGLIYTHAAFLLKARENGTCFNTILTLGRQSLYLTQGQYRRLAKRGGLKGNVSALPHEQYADRFLKTLLDAKSVLSLDYSAYENCDIVHDMNQPVPSTVHEKFDAVIDGGTLEHIFHFPVAISNCMKMVKKHGSVFIFTTANNFLGHGFYQFGPELFFRIFESKNGFEIRNIVLEQHLFPGVELSSRTRMFAVRDPASLGERVGLVSRSPVMMLVHAVRNEVKDVLADYPIQTDYASIYNGTTRITRSSLKALGEKLLQHMPGWCRRYLIGKYQLRRYSFSNRRFYRRQYPF